VSLFEWALAVYCAVAFICIGWFFWSAYAARGRF
jgi:hypothetical protein